MNDDAKVDIHAGKDNVQGSAPCPPAIEFDLQDFWKKFKFYAEHVAPALSAAEQCVCTQIISRTLAEGTDVFSLSYAGLGLLTGNSVVTVQKAITALVGRGMLKILSAVKPGNSDPASKRIYRNTYRFVLPEKPIFTSRAVKQKPMYTLMEELGLTKRGAGHISSRLIPEDVPLLNMILTGLNHDEKQFYRELAMSKAGTDEDLDLYFRDEVVYARFGPIKLARYLNE